MECMVGCIAMHDGQAVQSSSSDNFLKAQVDSAGCFRDQLPSSECVIAGVVPRGRKFPFAVRLTTDVLADDGSAAMTAVSSASLALTNAGVQLSSPVAGWSLRSMLACILCSQYPVLMTE